MRYEIRALADFAQVPPSRVWACASDFAYWLEACNDLANAGLGDQVDREVFIWIDDGRRGIRAIEYPNGEVAPL